VIESLTWKEWEDLAILAERQARAAKRAGISVANIKEYALAAKCQRNADAVRAAESAPPLTLADLSPREREDQESHDRVISDEACPACGELLAITRKGFECVECGHVEDVAIVTPHDIEQGARP